MGTNKKINIIIVTCLDADFEEECIESVKENTEYPHTLTVYKNGKYGEDDCEPLSVIWNKLIKESKEDYICLLNSDTIVEKGWLKGMMRYTKKEEIGAVGPVSNNVGGEQKQEKGRGTEVAHTLSGFCMLFSKEVWKEVNGFDEGYRIQAEDRDFCAKLKNKDYKLLIVKDVFIKHRGGISFERTKDLQKEQRNEDKKRWREKWLTGNWALVMKNPERPMGSEQIKACKDRIPRVYIIKDKIPDELEWIVLFNNISYEIDTDVKIAWWMCDYRENIKNRKVDPDLIFLSNRELLDKYEKHYGAKAYYMPQHGLEGPMLKGKREVNWDVLFIGHVSSDKYHKDRMEIMKKIGKKHDVCWIHKGKYTPDQMYLYNNTKFNLSISIPKKGYTSNRTYNILSSGGFCLIRYFPGIEDLFKNHKHLVWFKTVKEAIELIDYYKKHEKERQQIAKNGYELYKEKHTPRHRLENIMDICRGKKDKFDGYL